ncbi:hemolysin family protein [Rufibacter roseolus]|uniref:hemolysin family protein n=1 Tax=Rufibacter roseolus TaxID=2817375 RepID=UPI001B3063AD|nr:hemolysin family protein [Rufibacter roseolus]
MEILIILLLTLLNGFFALSELSIISANKSRMAQKAKDGSGRAKTVVALLEAPEDFLSAIQVGITLIGIISGAYGGAALSDDMQRWLMGFSFFAPYAHTLSVVLVIGLITYFSIVIGELIPKSIALSNADGIALAVSPIIKGFTALTMPLVKLLSGSTSLVTKALGVKEQTEERLSSEELRQIIRTAGRQGVLAKEETRLHQNVFSFAGQKAKNLRTHRREVEYLDITQPLEVIREAIQASAHSKFPVTEGSLDNVVGVLTAKDFYEFLAKGKGGNLRDVVLKPIFLPESMSASTALNLFKRSKQYLGIVIDEYGTVEGILTLHDILEAIVGDIPDAHEVDEPEIVKREDGSLLVSGSIEVQALNRALKKAVVPRDEENYSTLAGFISFILGRFPATGERFTHAGHEFEVVDMDGVRIDKVLMWSIPEPAEDSEALNQVNA